MLINCLENCLAEIFKLNNKAKIQRNRAPSAVAVELKTWFSKKVNFARGFLV
jgi:hypothetical protein